MGDKKMRSEQRKSKDKVVFLKNIIEDHLTKKIVEQNNYCIKVKEDDFLANHLKVCTKTLRAVLLKM